MKPKNNSAQRQNHLILMVKTPKIGQVKTRLGKDIGAVAATRFYRTTAHRLITQLASNPGWRTYIAIAPDATLNHWPWPNAAIKEPQGPGNLGDRMQRLIKRHAPNPTLIIGTDIPAIKPKDIRRAFKVLGQKPVVLGPSGDGGYWSVGQNNAPRTLTPFPNVRWSTKHTLDDTLNNLPKQAVTLINTIEDIDTGMDFKTHYQSCQGRWCS